MTRSTIQLETPRQAASVAGEPPPTATGARFDTLALMSAVVGVLALTPLPPALRAILLAIFVLTGPGLAVVTWMRLQAPAVAAAIPVLGLTMMTGFTAILGWWDLWIPIPLLLALAVGVTFSALLHAQHTGGLATLAPAVPRGTTPTANGPLLWTLAALGVWLALLPGLIDVPYSEFGLLAAGTGPGLVVVAVLVGNFLWALRKNHLATAAIIVGATILVQRATASLITEAPIYTWTYKHIGVVDYIQQFQTLPPRDIDVYGEWPAFFTAFAWFGDVSGLDSLATAQWFAPLMHALLALLVGALAMLVGLEIRHAIAAAMIIELVNWVGQDYFAPQALALLMTVGVLALLVASRHRHQAGYIALVAFAALIPTHQLTPYWLLGVIIALSVTRQIRPWWLPIPYLAMLVGYLLPRMYVLLPHGLFSGLNPMDNGSSNVEYAGSVGKIFTSTVCRGLSAAVVVVAVVAIVVWWRQGRPFGIPVIIAFSSFTLLFLQNYGGEAIFRVYLYALPGCAILIAPLLVDAATGTGRSVAVERATAVLAAVTLSAAATAGLQGYYGLWPLIVEYRSQVQLFEELSADILGPAMITSLDSAGFSTRSTFDYAELAMFDPDFDAPIVIRWPEFAKGFPDTNQFEDITLSAESSSAETYFVFTEQANDAVNYYRYFSPGAVAEFEDQFRSSPLWSIRLQDNHTTVYHFDRTAPVVTVNADDSVTETMTIEQLDGQ
ncbi:hypothetical protein [Rhodococcus marinonascens]|uniref:hypothetical protein n=1 Tax=Rhodococcus marinonascens TaxID=38311 RepID=UPI0009351E57|nr:hypothetical protein [Rhodococcus marinonascens]